MIQKLAPWEKRAINFIIDIFVIQFLNLFLSAVIGMLYYKISNLSGEVTYNLNNNYYLFLVFVLYYLVAEYFFSRTIGKLITKTIVVSNDGAKLKIKQILLRSVTRLFFIEVVSYFKKEPVGWHDSISSTKVVNNSEKL
jgi:uncharacterized RDD family membrane protein YckC